MTPTAGIVLVAAWGTQYVLRLPQEVVTLAIGSGAKTITKWTGGGQTDVSKELGPDWVFGGWLKQEPQWCRALFERVEGHDGSGRR